MVNPIRQAINEEVQIFVSKWTKAILIMDRDNSLMEFKDALEHHIQKVTKRVTDEERIIVHETAESKAELKYTRILEDTNRLLALAEKSKMELTERNGRLHEETKKLQNRCRDYERKINSHESKLVALQDKVYEPLVVYRNNSSKVEIFTDPLIKHLEEEVAFLRTLVAKFSE